MTRFQKIVASISMCIALFIGVGMVLPQDWVVTKTCVIEASPEAIYPLVSNFKTGWVQWNVFDIEDKKGVYIYEQPLDGTGAYRSWKSTKIGNGWQKIASANPTVGVDVETFLERRQFRMLGEIRLVKMGNNTQVIFTQKGRVGKGIFLRYLIRAMDLGLGEVMEKSLENLKKTAESK